MTAATKNGRSADSRVVSLRLRDDQLKSLQHHGRFFGRSVGATAALLFEEKLREEDNPWIEFRNTPEGRQTFAKGTRLKVWQVAMLAREVGTDAGKISKHLRMPKALISACLTYADRYPEEIRPVVDEVVATSRADLEGSLPGMVLGNGG